MKPINRLLIMLVMLLAGTTGAWAQTEEVAVEQSQSDENKWVISNMPASNVELEVEYYSDEEMMSGEGLELTQQDDGTWTLDAMPAFNVELEIEYYPEEYEYTITDAMVGTLYLDFAAEIPDEDLFVPFYVQSIDAKGIMHLKKIDDVIPANTATIIFGNAGTYTMTEADSEVESITGNMLKGVLEATSVADLEQENGTDIYVLSRAQNAYIGFRKAGGAVKTIPANRAYLPYTASNSIQELSISFEEEEVTGISDIADHTNSGETKIYNLAGQRVTNPQHGIYIVNGKKVYIR